MRGSGFVEYVRDQLRSWGPVVARRMFSGEGMFRDGVMFALVHDDTLYFRTDATNAPDFAAAGMSAFTYRRGGRTVALGYSAVPPDVLDAGDELALWADKAFRAALAKAAARPRHRR
jgi:DNA transformation protein and related proteins